VVSSWSGSLSVTIGASTILYTVTAKASSERQPASYAIDNNIATRWESDFNIDPSWIYVDLGGVKSISRVTIDWEAANAQDYQVQGSNDATTWTTLVTKTGMPTGNHRIDDITGLSGSYRYVRVYGTRRNLTYGYSIWEMKVYGPSPR